MIQVISYLQNKVKLSNVQFNYIYSEYPYDEIFTILRNIPDNDIVIMLPPNTIPTKKLLVNIVKKYKKEKNVSVFNENETDKSLINLSHDYFSPDDIIIFQKSRFKYNKLPIPHMSDYNKIRDKIIRKCGNLYVPENRAVKKPEPIVSRPSTTSPTDIQKDERIYKLRLNMGIGDMIYGRAVLDSLRGSYFDKIIISPNSDVHIKVRKPNENDMKFSLELFNLLFKPPYYEIDMGNSNYPQRYTMTFKNIDKFELVKPYLSDELCEGKSLDIGPYVVITTRIRGIRKEYYNSTIKDKLKTTLKKISKKCKIVIMGERNLIDYPEHSMNKNFIYCIYDDIISSVPQDRILDLSFLNIHNIKEDRMKKLKQEALYMKEALFNITLGIGGLFCLSTAVGKVIGLYDNTIPEGADSIYNNKKYTDIHIVNNVDSFFSKLDEFCNTSDINKFHITKENKKILKANLYLGIGSLIYIKAMLDNVKENYDKIYVSPKTSLLDWIHPGKKDWYTFKDDLIKLFFSESPYIITKDQSYPDTDYVHLVNKDIKPVIPDLKKYLCIGTLPDKLIENNYIVLSTKVRWFYKDFYHKTQEHGLYNVLTKLAKKYQLVIMGERVVERNAEYEPYYNHTYSLYDDIIKNIPNDLIMDLTYSAYGISSPNLNRLQQDLYVMSKSKYSIILGIGGPFCQSTAVAKTIVLDDPKDPDPVLPFLYKDTDINDKVWLTRSIYKFLDRLENL